MPDKQVKVDLNLTGNKITNLGDPSAGSDAVNLSYLTNFVNQRTWHNPARAATTGNINLSSPGASVDGVALNNGDRVLVRAQSTGSQNGVYDFNGASSAMTRSTDADSGTELKGGFSLIVTEGSTYADSQWICTTDGTVTIGSTTITFTQNNSGGTTYSADGNGIELSSTTFSLELDGTSLSKSSSGLRIGSAAAANGLVESSGLLSVGAGTGVTVNANDVAVDTSLVARWKSATAGNGSATDLTLTHNLGNPYHLASCQDASTGEEFETKIVKGANSTTFTFASAPANNSVVLVVIG